MHRPMVPTISKETKPNPEIFLKAAEKLNVLPSECIVIEDSSAGIRAAFNARMIAIHVVDLKEADEDILNNCYNSYKNLNEIQKVLIKNKNILNKLELIYLL